MYNVYFYTVHSACIFQHNPHTPVPSLSSPGYGLLWVYRWKPIRLLPSISSKQKSGTGHLSLKSFSRHYLYVNIVHVVSCSIWWLFTNLFLLRVSKLLVFMFILSQHCNLHVAETQWMSINTNVHFRSYYHLNFLSHFSKSLTPSYPLFYEGTYRVWYLMFSVEVVVERSETFSSVAAAIRSTNEVFDYQSDVDQCYSVAWEKGMLKQNHAMRCNFQFPFCVSFAIC